MKLDIIYIYGYVREVGLYILNMNLDYHIQSNLISPNYITI